MAGASLGGGSLLCEKSEELLVDLGNKQSRDPVGFSEWPAMRGKIIIRKTHERRQTVESPKKPSRMHQRLFLPAELLCGNQTQKQNHRCAFWENRWPW